MPQSSHTNWLSRCDDLQSGGRQLNLFLLVGFEDGSTYEHFDSQSIIVLYGTGATAEIADGGAGYPSNPKDPRIDWWLSLVESKLFYRVWASDEAANEIVQALLGGSRWVVLKVLFSDAPAAHSFGRGRLSVSSQ